MLKVGVGREDMTPPVGIAHTLWGARTRETADRIHLPLNATALCIENDGTRVLIVDIDVTGLPTPVCDELRAAIHQATGIPIAHVSIGVTHTHSAPVWAAETTNGASSDLPGMDMMPGWRKKVREAVVAAAATAFATLKPARFASGYGESEVTVHRRFTTPEGRVVVSPNPGGIRDTTMTVLRFDDLDGNTIASVVGYGTHPIVLAHQNSAISSEFPGALKSAIEALMGGTCLFLQGCAGDQIPFEALTGDVKVAERIGKRIAADAGRALTALSPLNYRDVFSHVVESGAPLGMKQREVLADTPAPVAVAKVTVDLPVRAFEPIETLEARAAETRAEFLALDRSSGDHAKFAEVHFRARRADIMLTMARRAHGTSVVPIEIRAIRIGESVLVSAPMEIFAATGIAIRESSPFATTFIGGYTNGTEGYLPLAESYVEGGYEVELACYVSPEAEGIFREAAKRLVAGLHAGKA